MANSTSGAGLVRSGARIAFGFVHDQALAVLAPWYWFQRRHAIVEMTGEIAHTSTCGPKRAIDLQPTGLGRS